jgi:hypothetical protein
MGDVAAALRKSSLRVIDDQYNQECLASSRAGIPFHRTPAGAADAMRLWMRPLAD